MSALAGSGRLLSQLAAALLFFGAALSLGCGGDVPLASPTPEPFKTPTPDDGLSPAALVMTAWAGDLRNCVIDRDSGALGPCQRGTMGDPGAGHAAIRGAVAPGGKLAILGVDDLVWAFHVDASGLVEDAGTVRFRTEGWVSGVVLHPVRQTAYVSTGDKVYAYDFTAGGDLTPVPGSPFPIATRALVFRPDGAFAYAAGPVTDERSLAVYRVDASGALTEVVAYSAGPVRVDSPGRGDVVIDRTGRYLVTREVAVFRIDEATGRLGPVHADPRDAVTLAAHPDQDLIFRARASGEYSRALDTMQLDLRSGALSVVSTVEMLPPHHGGYTRLVVEPASRSLYHVTTHGIDEGMEIVRYGIDASGALSPPRGMFVLSGESFQTDFVPFLGPR